MNTDSGMMIDARFLIVALIFIGAPLLAYYLGIGRGKKDE